MARPLRKRKRRANRRKSKTFMPRNDRYQHFPAPNVSASAAAGATKRTSKTVTQVSKAKVRETHKWVTGRIKSFANSFFDMYASKRTMMLMLKTVHEFLYNQGYYELAHKVGLFAESGAVSYAAVVFAIAKDPKFGSNLVDNVNTLLTAGQNAIEYIGDAATVINSKNMLRGSDEPNVPPPNVSTSAGTGFSTRPQYKKYAVGTNPVYSHGLNVKYNPFTYNPYGDQNPNHLQEYYSRPNPYVVAPERSSFLSSDFLSNKYQQYAKERKAKYDKYLDTPAYTLADGFKPVAKYVYSKVRTPGVLDAFNMTRQAEIRKDRYEKYLDTPAYTLGDDALTGIRRINTALQKVEDIYDAPISRLGRKVGGVITGVGNDVVQEAAYTLATAPYNMYHAFSETTGPRPRVVIESGGSHQGGGGIYIPQNVSTSAATGPVSSNSTVFEAPVTMDGTINS